METTLRKILILGAGRMGSWLADSLCLNHDVAVYDSDLEKLKYFFKTTRLINYQEIRNFQPEILINAVSLERTVQVFEEVLPYLPQDCIISDIASVKNGLQDYYKNLNRRFVSTHPMFGPTFGNVKDLSSQNAIIIEESDEEGKKFFWQFYKSLKLQIFNYTFDEHDETIAYSLSIPFASTMVFAACMKKLEVPGTTFKKHLGIANGLLSEDDYLLSEILLSPYTINQVEKIKDRLSDLINLINEKDSEGIHKFLQMLRNNVGFDR